MFESFEWPTTETSSIFKLNEDILHNVNCVPEVGSVVKSVFKSQHGDQLTIIIDGCEPIILVGDFKEAKVPVMEYGDDNEVIIDGVGTGKKWSEFFKK